MEEGKPEEGSAPEVTTEKRVYVGRRYSSHNGKIAVAHTWMTLDENGEPTGKELWYSKQPVACSIGQVFLFTLAAGDRIYISGDRRPAYLFTFDDERTILEWQARDQIAWQAQVNQRMQKSEAVQDLMEKHLAPLKVTYDNLHSFYEKACFLEIVEGYLTRPRPPKK